VSEALQREVLESIRAIRSRERTGSIRLSDVMVELGSRGITPTERAVDYELQRLRKAKVIARRAKSDALSVKRGWGWDIVKHR